MKTQRRLDIIEMALTPRQVVALVFEEAQQQGAFESLGLELARRPAACCPRTRVMELVTRTVRDSMKGYPDAIAGNALRQARQEADFLYLLAINTNATVLEYASISSRFASAIARHLRTILKAAQTAEELNECRKSLSCWLEELLILEGVVDGLAAEYFDGQRVLFNDVAEKLNQQLANASQLVKCFNFLAGKIGSRAVDLQRVRTRLQPAVEQQIANKAALARVEMLITFGEPDSADSQLIRILSESCHSQSNEHEVQD